MVASGAFFKRKIVRLEKEVHNKEKELELALVRVREVDQLKDDIVSLAAHQIRSPLVAIRGYASMIAEGDFGNVEMNVQDAIQRISDSSKNLMNIANEFLDISHIEEGRIKYNLKEFDLKHTLTRICEKYEKRIKEKGLDFSFDYEKNLDYMVFADREKIKRIIQTVVENAIRYTREGKIKVSLSSGNGKAIVSVTDTGIGISKKDSNRIFHRFARTSNASRIDTTGTGIELYIAKEMLHAQGGHIYAISEGSNKGSTFVIEIKLASNIGSQK